MNYLKISIIIPVYNRALSLQETLSCIFKSDYPNFEVIVYDDASTENIKEAIKDFKCIYIRSEENSGPAVGRNEAAKKATGDILLFTDSDILIPADTLYKINEQITFHNYDGVVGILTPEIRYKNYSSNLKNLYMNYVFYKMPPSTSFFYTSIASIKKKIFEEVGGFDENFGKIPCEDNELGLRLSSKCKIKLLYGLEVEHVRHFNFISLLKKDFLIASSLIRTNLRYKSSKIKINKKDIPTLKSFTSSIGLSGVLLSFLFLSLFNIYFLYFSIFLTLLILIINSSFLFFLMKKKGFLFFIKSCCFIFLEYFSYGFGTLTGIIGFVFGKKY